MKAWRICVHFGRNGQTRCLHVQCVSDVFLFCFDEASFWTWQFFWHMLLGVGCYVTMSVQNESLRFRMRIDLTMCAAMHSEADPGCKRRRLMHKQTVCEVDWRGNVSGDVASCRMSLVGDGSHAHLSANVVLPAVSEEAPLMPVDQDVSSPLTNPPPLGVFFPKRYTIGYIRRYLGGSSPRRVRSMRKHGNDANSAVKLDRVYSRSRKNSSRRSCVQKRICWMMIVCFWKD